MAQVSIIAGINRQGYQSPPFIPNATWGGWTVTCDNGDTWKTKDRGLRGRARVQYIGPVGGNVIKTANGQMIELESKSGIGFFNSAPDASNADSIPPTSWWDSQWTCQQWMIWHQANVTKYDQKTANTKFITYASQVSGWASDHFCPYESGFHDYFTSQGINFDNPLASLYVDTTQVAAALGQGAVNLSSSAMDLTGLVKIIAPIAFFGVGIWAVDKYMYPIFSKPKAAVSGKRRKKK